MNEERRAQPQSVGRLCHSLQRFNPHATNLQADPDRGHRARSRVSIRRGRRNHLEVSDGLQRNVARETLSPHDAAVKL